MTDRILHIDSSVFGSNGVSAQLGQYLVRQLAQGGAVPVMHRDLAQDPLPHYTAEVITALGMSEADRNAHQRELADLSDQLIEQVKSADVLVVGAPMYNFAVPSTLKAWLDFISRPGATFRYTDAGPEGLLTDKTLYLITSRGGVYKDQHGDLLVPYLKLIFNFLGITDIRVIYAEGINMGQKEQSMRLAKATIDELVAPPALV